MKGTIKMYRLVQCKFIICCRTGISIKSFSFLLNLQTLIDERNFQQARGGSIFLSSSSATIKLFAMVSLDGIERISKQSPFIQKLIQLFQKNINISQSVLHRPIPTHLFSYFSLRDKNATQALNSHGNFRESKLFVDNKIDEMI